MTQTVKKVRAQLKGGTIAQLIVTVLTLTPGAELLFLQEALRPAHPNAVEKEVSALLEQGQVHDLDGHLFAYGDTRGMAAFLEVSLAELRGYRAGTHQFITEEHVRNPYPALLTADGRPHPETPEGNAWVAAWGKVAEVFSRGVQGRLRAFWRHTKVGGHYTELGRAELQASTGPVSEGQRLVIYQGQDGRLWARPEAEFEDGRFEWLAQKEHITRPATQATTQP